VQCYEKPTDGGWICEFIERGALCERRCGAPSVAAQWEWKCLCAVFSEL